MNLLFRGFVGLLTKGGQVIWGLPSSQKKWPIFTNLGQGLSQKVDFFLIFRPILRPGFFDKMLALLNKKSTFVLVSGFFGCCIFTTVFKQYSKGRFLTKNAP